MKTSVFLVVTLVVITLAPSSAYAVLKIQTFDTAPQYTEDDFDFNRTDEPGPPLESGRYATREEDNETTSHRLDDHNLSGLPIWNSGGWIQPIGRETALDNRGPVGPNAEGLAPTAILTSVFTGVWITDETSWGDVSDATYVTFDVKGSFAGSGGMSLFVFGDGGFVWSWGAAATDLAVGANPGDVTEWTNILIPINKPERQSDGSFPPEPGEEGVGGNWGTSSGFVDDEAMREAWDLTFASVYAISVLGITPDTQIDNLGFVLPDVGTPGDFDADNDVDGTDFLVWQQGFGDTHDAADLADWEANFGTAAVVTSIGAVPEPSAIGLALLAGCGMLCARRKRGS